MRYILLVLLALPNFASAADVLPGPIWAEVIRVLDSDRIEVRARLWFDKYVQTEVRLAGIDAPLSDGRCEREKTLALKTAARLAELAKPGSRVRLTKIKEGKSAGRVVAQVSFQYLYSQEQLTTVLIDEGLGRRHKGGRRRGWCDGE